MNIQIKELTRDRVCQYCGISEYQGNFAIRRYFSIRATRDTPSIVISICEKCARELYALLSELIDRNAY